MEKRRTSEPIVHKANSVSMKVINPGNNPGPSDYHVRQAHIIGNDGPAYHMRQKTPIKDLRDGFPAPGDYKHESALSQISYSFAKKYSHRSGMNLPGPASYDSKNQTAHNWARGPRIDLEVRYRTNKLKAKEDSETPGPSSYRLPIEEPKNDRNRTTSPAFGFGSSPKNPELRPITPGPGSYEYSPQIGIEASRATIGNAARNSAHLL